MPEGPETRTIAEVVNRAVGLTDSSVLPLRVRGEVEYEGTLRGRLYTVGKVVVVDAGNTQVLAGMGMTGTLCPRQDIGKHIRTVIEIDGTPVAFRDPRKFGKVWLTRYSAPVWASCPEKALGLAPSWIDRRGMPQREAAMQSAIACKSRRAIHAVLLDQRAVISGVGNIYASEACFDAGVDPRQPWASLSQEKKKAVVNAAIDIMLLSLRDGGSSVLTYDAGGQKGSFQNMLRVYGKDGQKAYREGKYLDVKKATLGGRSVYYVEQP